LTKQAGALIKQSFERRAKRLGLATSEESAIEAAELDKFKGSKFWIWDRNSHRKEYERTGGHCCFNHMLPSLPVKNGQEMPLFPWQQEVYDALEHNKNIAILKGRGVGGTQMLLLWAFYLCVKDDQMRNKNMVVVTGIREDLSIELIRRFKNLMPNLKWNTRENLAELRGCRVIGYPSKRTKDLRGLDQVALVICDEYDHFDPNDQIQVRPVLEAFQVKSNATICLLSTPGPIGSEMNKLFDLQEDKCQYKRLFIPIQKALGTLISIEEANKIRASPNYLQEFELRFSSYGAGSIFSLDDISKAVGMGKRYANPKFNPMAAKVPYPYVDPTVQHYLGCDPGWGNSKTGITLVSMLNRKAHVIIAEEHYQKDEDFIIQRLLRLREKTGRPKRVPIFVDGSAVSLIRRLKSCIPGEIPDYENYINDLRKRKLVRPPQEMQLLYYMQVIPVPFSKFGPSMLSNLHTILSQGNLVIHPKFTMLIAQLQSARNVLPNNRNSNQFVLEKTPQNSMDLLDSLRLALWNIEAGAPEISVEDEEEYHHQGEDMITVR
jgi:hypothetical protein